MLSKNAVIYELENALKLATEYIQQQDEEIKALKAMNSIREYARSNNIKVSEAGLVGISDSALLLGVSTSTVRAMINAREIPCVKTRGRVQVHIDDIELYINNQRHKAI